MQRIVVIGATGSGKSTLATRLAALLDLRLIDLDDLYWQPGWRETPPQEFRTTVERAINETPRWVTAGNYSAIRDITWNAADTIIWLDYNFPRTFYQLLRRSLTRIADKTLICNGNHETLHKLLSRDSIMLWLLRSFYPRKRDFTAVFAAPRNHPHIRNFIRLKNPRQTRAFLVTATPA